MECSGLWYDESVKYSVGEILEVRQCSVYVQDKRDVQTTHGIQNHFKVHCSTQQQ